MAEDRFSLPTVAGASDEAHHLERERVLRLADGAIAPEGTAAEETGEARAAVAWLFQANEEPREARLDALPELIAIDENLVWVDLGDFHPDDLQHVAALLSLRERAVKAAASAWQQPRIDILGDQFFVSVTVAELDEQARRVIARQLDLVVGGNFLLSAHKQPLPFRRQILARAGHDPDLVRLDSGFMLYIVLDELLAYFETLDGRLRGEIEQLQERALRDTSERFLEEMVRYKRYAFALGQLVQQHEQVFHAFLRPDFPFLSAPEVHEYFGGLETRLLRLITRLEHTQQEVTSTFEIYISRQTHRTNGVMKVLTMAATVLFTATFIEGLFSPSFYGIPTHSAAGFVIMLILIALASATAFGLFRWRGWM